MDYPDERPVPNELTVPRQDQAPNADRSGIFQGGGAGHEGASRGGDVVHQQDGQSFYPSGCIETAGSTAVVF